jgi:hypothetical protein
MNPGSAGNHPSAAKAALILWRIYGTAEAVPLQNMAASFVARCGISYGAFPQRFQFVGCFRWEEGVVLYWGAAPGTILIGPDFTILNARGDCLHA